MTQDRTRRAAKTPSQRRPRSRAGGGARDMSLASPGKRAAKREAILMAALDEFSINGFAAARLDDVAKRAGVAKGTIYLYFADKETLFQELARSMMSPLVGNIEGFATADIPLPMLLEGLADLFTREVIGSRRKDIIRLIISEGPRFPSLAEFY